MPASADAAWALGIVFIVLVAAFWAGSSVLTQFIFDNLSFNEPFVLTYIGTSLFMIFIPGWLTLSFFKCVDNPPYRRDPSVQVSTECCDSRYELVGLTSTLPENMDNDAFSGEDAFLDNVERADARISSGQQLEEPIIESPMPKKDNCSDRTSLNSASHEQPHSGMMSHLGTARVSLIVCPIWFIANWSYNQSLSMTSVTSSTIISTTSSLFSFALSVCFAGETYSKAKLAGVFCTIAGTVMVAFADANGDDDNTEGESRDVSSVLAGDGVALIGAIAYSCYTVLIKVYVPNDDAVAMPLLFGYLGMLNALILAPFLFLAAVFSRGGIFENLSPEVFGLICLGGLFDNVLSDYLWARAVVLTTPTIATVGLSLTIPLAFLSDAFFNAVVPSPLSALGALTVIAGFILVNVGDGSFESRAAYLTMKARAAGRWLKATCRLT